MQPANLQDNMQTCSVPFYLPGSGFHQNDVVAHINSVLSLDGVPNNRDQNAIHVVGSGDRIVGWIPRNISASGLARFIDQGQDRQADVQVVAVQRSIPTVRAIVRVTAPAEETSMILRKIREAVLADRLYL